MRRSMTFWSDSRDFVQAAPSMDMTLWIFASKRRMVDAACGGSILNMTPDEAMDKLIDMAKDTRSFGRTYTTKGVNAASSSDNPELIREISELKKMVSSLTKPGGQQQQVMACGICFSCAQHLVQHQAHRAANRSDCSNCVHSRTVTV